MRYLKSLLAFILMVLLASCEKEPQPDTRTLIEKLNDLEGVTATAITPPYGHDEAFKLEITQLLDHNNPNGPTFTQTAYLHHSGTEMPMVFGPSGYGATEWSTQEIAGLLGTNMLMVVHRFFPGSEPYPLDWDYLNIWQSATDHHHIVTLLKGIYTGSWISSGASKGGQTSLFHRRYYPDDVDVTIAYVAPIVFGTHDERFITFMENVGDYETREKLKNFERRLLEARDSIMPRFVNWFPENNYILSLNPDEAFEYGILEYHFAFWQFHNYDIDDIPGDDATYDEMFYHLDNVLWVRVFSDYYMDYYNPYYIQALKENGYPAYSTAHLSDLLTFVTDPGAEFFVTADVSPDYDPSTVLDINSWLKTDGNNIIYIYGELDPWSAAMFDPDPETNALRVVQQGEDHGVKIADLDEKERIIDSLEVWLGIQIDYY
ncbi:MAG TPA: S28 family serine protease [Bacteroidales bacterium]|nr:S28 family serine protease [Bacteroidales bacterium]